MKKSNNFRIKMFSEELKSFQLSEIFYDKYFYKIPRYQRNFAWSEKEVLELLLDIYNQYKNNRSNYYIGSLVVFKNENVYEVIDGQQRLTVITLIYLYILILISNS